MRAIQVSRGQASGIFIVADGMGGEAAGEVASGLAVRSAAAVVLTDYLVPQIAAEPAQTNAQLEAIVQKAVRAANRSVLCVIDERNIKMGTTFVMALVAESRVAIGNIGDSRAYLYRGGELTRIGQDHSLVMRLVMLGQLDEHEIYDHPQRHVILRSLGDLPDVEADVFLQSLHPDDGLMLCCDGQWEKVRD